MSGNAKHPYHLVDPSPWPLFGSVAAGTLAVGAILMLHYKISWVLFLGLGLVLLTMFVWWKDVIREAEREGHHTKAVQFGHRMGMGLFIVSEVMFFFAFFWAYFNASLDPTEAINFTWPPKDIETIPAFDLPFLNTLLLLLSGCTVTWAHHALLHGDREGLKKGLLATSGIGLLFLMIQGYEYHHAAFTLDQGIYPTTFYLATGFHGFHVMIGTLFLTVCLLRAFKGHFKTDQHVGFEAAAWYWHFVDVVWLFLFVSIYWFGGN